MTRILTVDDEPINQMIIEEALASTGYQLDQADDGDTAWNMLQEQAYDLVLLDRMMPRLDGISLLRRVRADPRCNALPVIMVTGAGKRSEILEGMAAGTYHYLTKPFDPNVLCVMVGTVVARLAEQERLKETSTRLRDALSLFEHGEVRFRTLAEARTLAAAMSGLFASQGASADTGLLELLVNAIEHGNLCIGYQEKSRLLLAGQWEAEVERRLTLAPWSTRLARLSFHRDADTVVFTITDQGDGFDWRPYMAFDPERVFDLNGRGIAKANTMSFKSLEYQGNGNAVVAAGHASRRGNHPRSGPIRPIR
jgi:DNA-binding response OmpR family regulator